MDTSPSSQRMFHGYISAAALADQLAARFRERHMRVSSSAGDATALVQLGSQHGTPVTVHIAETQGGVLVTMGRDNDWLDRASDASGMLERAGAGNPLSLLAMVPEVIAELGKDNIVPDIWNTINDICALTRSLAGERNAPPNPKVCQYCGTANPDAEESCLACGAALPVNLPRICPKCARAHTSDALFCQACGTRLVEG
ncbi:MAG: zinc ribbon domain-containing protein [Anaerolineaceae bacterium]|nr:zinc ribbon domain-containing protein [Anaerolineaceae bacterium]